VAGSNRELSGVGQETIKPMRKYHQTEFGIVAGLFALLVFFAVAPISAQAQAFEEVALFQETINADFFGVDARAMAMGNTGVVSARDGSGLIYNPANLARVRRIEFRAGLSHLRLSNSTDIHSPSLGLLSDERDQNKTRINALSLTLPVPTYRGSLVVAFGVHRINSFDRAFGARIPEPEVPAFETSRGREIETGGLWKWSAGGAIDISPRLAAGLSLNLITGKDSYGWNRVYANADDAQTITLDQGIDNDYVGVGATAGLNFTISPALSVGLSMETPTYLSADERFESVLDTAFSSFEWFETSYSEYSVTRPLSFGLGAAGSFDRLMLVGDVHYTDWSELTFDYQDDFLPNNREEQFIQDNLKEAISLHIGAEYLFPDEGVALRAGYFRDPLPIDEKFIESERQYLTLGAGFLIDRVMALDLAYVHGGYELRDAAPGSFFADYNTRRIFATFAYRI